MGLARVARISAPRQHFVGERLTALLEVKPANRTGKVEQTTNGSREDSLSTSV
jgi:hypothetical protein